MSKLVDYVKNLEKISILYVFVVDIVIIVTALISTVILLQQNSSNLLVVLVIILFVTLIPKIYFTIKNRESYFHKAIILCCSILMLIVFLNILLFSTLGIQNHLGLLLFIILLTILSFIASIWIVQTEVIKYKEKPKYYYSSFIGVSLVIFWSADGFALFNIPKSDNTSLLLIPLILFVFIMTYLSAKLLVNAKLYKKVRM